MINLKPVHSIGKFFALLSPRMKKQAKSLARRAGRMPKPEIDKEVYFLEQSSRYNNIA